MDDDGLSAAIARAFPDGLATNEKEALTLLPDERRLWLTNRLTAVVDWVAHGGGDATTVSARLGLRPAQFYKIVRDWKRTRSLKALGVRVDGRRRGSGRHPAAGAIADTLARLLDDRPDMSTGELVRAVSAQVAAPASKTTILRAIREARGRRLLGPFGQRVVMDSAGLDLLDPEGMQLRLYAALDERTGFVLGAMLGTARMGALGYAWLAVDVLDEMFTLELPPIEVSTDAPELEFRLTDGDEAGAAMFAHLSPVAPPSVGAARVPGAALVQALGEKLQGVWLGTGDRAPGVSFRTGRRQPMPTVTVDAALALERGIEAHNDAVLARLPRSGTADGAAAALAAVRRRLEEVAAVAEAAPSRARDADGYADA